MRTYRLYLLLKRWDTTEHNVIPITTFQITHETLPQYLCLDLDFNEWVKFTIYC